MFAAIRVFIFSIFPALAIHVLKALGIGIVTFAAFSVALTLAENFIFSQLGQLTDSLYSLLKMIGLISGLKIYFSALAAASLIKSAGASSQKKIALK